MKSNWFIKITALFTSLCLIAEQSWAALPAIPSPAPSITAEASGWSSKNFPAELGSIEEFWAPETAPGNSLHETIPAVILIQDAHGQLEAQQRTAQILDFLSRKAGSDSLFIEGGVGELDPGRLSFFQEVPLNTTILESFLKQGEIGGAELFLWNAGTPGAMKAVFGLEEPALFVQGVHGYRGVARDHERTENLLARYAADWDRSASRTLRPELFRLVREWGAYERRETGFAAYLKMLSEYALQHLKLDLSAAETQLEYPMMVRLAELRRRETKLDRRTADEERRKLAAWCRGQQGLDTAFAGYLETFNIRKTAVPLPWQSLRNFWEQFYLGAKVRGFRFQDYPALTLEEGFRILESEIDAAGLFGEMDELRERILETLGVKPEEKDLLDRYRRFLLLQKMLSLNLTFSEFKSLESKETLLRREVPAEIQETFEKALGFYRTAVRRDEVMAENLVRVRTERSLKHSLVVAGGFHTEGLRNFLKEKGLSYAVVRPHLSEIEPASVYEAAMTDTLPSHGLMDSTSRVANFLNAVEQWRGWGLPMDRRARFIAEALRWGRNRGGHEVSPEGAAAESAAIKTVQRAELRAPTEYENLLKRMLDKADRGTWSEEDWDAAFREILFFQRPDMAAILSKISPLADPSRRPAGKLNLTPSSVLRPGDLLEPKGLDPLGGVLKEYIPLSAPAAATRVSQIEGPKILTEDEQTAVEKAAAHAKHDLAAIYGNFRKGGISLDLARSYFLENAGVVYRVLWALREDAYSGLRPTDLTLAPDAGAGPGTEILRDMLRLRERMEGFVQEGRMRNVGLADPAREDEEDMPFSPLMPLVFRRAGFIPSMAPDAVAALFDANKTPVRRDPADLLNPDVTNPVRRVTLKTFHPDQPPYLLIEFSRPLPGFGTTSRYLRAVVLKEPLAPTPQDFETTDAFIRDGFVFERSGKEGLAGLEVSGARTDEQNAAAIARLKSIAQSGRLLIQDIYELGPTPDHARRYADFIGRNNAVLEGENEVEAIYKGYLEIQERERDSNARLSFATGLGLGGAEAFSDEVQGQAIQDQMARTSALYDYEQLRQIRESAQKKDLLSPLVSLVLTQIEVEDEEAAPAEGEAPKTHAAFLISDEEMKSYGIKTLIEKAAEKKLERALATVQSEIKPSSESPEDVRAAQTFRDVLALEVIYRLLYEMASGKSYFRKEVRHYFWMSLVNRAETLWRRDLTASRIWLLTVNSGREFFEEDKAETRGVFWDYFLRPAESSSGQQLLGLSQMLTLRERQLFPGELPVRLRNAQEPILTEKIGFERIKGESALVSKIREFVTTMKAQGIPELIRMKQDHLRRTVDFYEKMLAVREHYESGRNAEGLVVVEELLEAAEPHALLDEKARESLREMKRRLESDVLASRAAARKTALEREAAALHSRISEAAELDSLVTLHPAIQDLIPQMEELSLTSQVESLRTAFETRLEDLAAADVLGIQADLSRAAEQSLAEAQQTAVRAAEKLAGRLRQLSPKVFAKARPAFNALRPVLENVQTVLAFEARIPGDAEDEGLIARLFVDRGSLQSKLPDSDPWKKRLDARLAVLARDYHDYVRPRTAAARGTSAEVAAMFNGAIKVLEGYPELQSSLRNAALEASRAFVTPREAFLEMEGPSERLKKMLVMVLETGLEKGTGNARLHREFFDYFLQKNGGATAFEKEIFEQAFRVFNSEYENIRKKARAGDLVTISEKHFYEIVREYGKPTDKRGSYDHISLQPSKALFLMAVNMARIFAGLAADKTLGGPSPAPLPSVPGLGADVIYDGFRRFLIRKNHEEGFLLYDVSAQAGYVPEGPAAGLDVSAILAMRRTGLLASTDSLDIYRILYKHEVESVSIIPAFAHNPPGLLLKLKSPYTDPVTGEVFPAIAAALSRERFPMAPRDGETMDLFIQDLSQLEILTFHDGTEAGEKKIKLGALKNLALQQRFVPASLYTAPYYQDTLHRLARSMARTGAEQWAIETSLKLGFNSGSSVKVQNPVQPHTASDFQALVDFFRQFGDPFAAYSHGAETRRKFLDSPVFHTMNANPTLRPLVRLMIRREGNDWLISQQDFQAYVSRLGTLAEEILNPAFPEIRPLRDELRAEEEENQMVARFSAELGLAVIAEIYKKGLRHTPRDKLEARLLKEVEIESRGSLAGFVPVTTASGRERDQKVRDAAAKEKIIRDGFAVLDFREARAAAMRKALEQRKVLGVRPVFFDFGSLEDFRESMEDVLELQQRQGAEEEDAGIVFLEQLVTLRESAERGDFAAALRDSRGLLAGQSAELVLPFYEAVRKAAMTEALGILVKAAQAEESEMARLELLRADALREVLELAGEEIRIFEDARVRAEEKALSLERLERQASEARAAALQAMNEALARAAAAETSAAVTEQLDAARVIHDTFNSKFEKAPLTGVEDQAYHETYDSAEARGTVLAAQEKRKSELEAARASSVRGRELLEDYAARVEAEPELAEHFWALMRAVREAPDYAGLAAGDKAGLMELEARVLRLLKGEPRQIADLLAQALEALSLAEPRNRSREESLESEIAALDPENARLLHRRGEIEKARQAALDSMMAFLRQAAASDSVTEIEGLLSQARHVRESFNTSFPGTPLVESELQTYQKGIESAEIRQAIVARREALGRDLTELMRQPGVAAGLVVPYLNQAVALSDAVTQPELLGSQERLTWHLTRAALLLAAEASAAEAAAHFAAALEILEKLEPRDSAREARLLAQIEALDPKNPVLLKRRMEGGRYETFRLILSHLEFAASARGLDVVQQAIAKAEALHEKIESAFPDKTPADNDEAARQKNAREKRETQYKEAHAAAVRNREVEEARLSFETAWKYLTRYRDWIGDQTPDETMLEQVLELFSKAVDRPEYDAMSAEQSRDFHLFAGAILSVEYLNDKALADAPAWEFDLALDAMEKLPVRDPVRELETENKIGELDKTQKVYARRTAERTEKQERMDQLQVSVGEDIRVMTDRMDSIRARLEQMRRDLEGLQVLGMTAGKAAAEKAKIDGLELAYEEKAIGFEINELVERSNAPRVQKPIAYFKSRSHGLSAKINLVRRFGKPGREAEARLLSKLSYAESQIRTELRTELAPVLAGTMIDGTFSPLQQMRSEQDWGVADFATMLREILLKARLGQRLAQVLPLNLPKAFNSPYSPKSSRLMDPLNIGIPGLLKTLEQEFGIRIPETEALMAGLEPEILRLRASGQVEHETVLALKKKVLEAVWNHLSQHAAEPGYQSFFEEFQAFQAKNESWLEDHLLYQELLDEHTAKDPGKGWDWREWPDDVKNRDAAAVAALKIQHRTAIDFNKFLQFIAGRQFRALKDQAKKLGISIMVDIPLAQDGADVWLQPEVFGLKRENGFRRQVSQGVPPDPFSDFGQYWQFFPYDFTNPATLQYIRELYAFNQQRADYVRLDHVLGFYRQYFFTEDPGRAWTFERLGLDQIFDSLRAQAEAGMMSKAEAAASAVEAVRERLVQMRVLARTGVLPAGLAPDREATLREALAAVPADALDLLLDESGRLNPDNMLAIFRSIPEAELDPVLDKEGALRADTLAGLFLRTLHEERENLSGLQGHFHHDSMTVLIDGFLARNAPAFTDRHLRADDFFMALRREILEKIGEFAAPDASRQPRMTAFFEKFENQVRARADAEFDARGFWKREYRAEPKTSEEYTPVALGVGEDKQGQADPYVKYMEHYLFPAEGRLPQKEDRLSFGYFRRVSNAETILSDLLRMSQEQGTVMIWEVLGVVPPKIQESVNRLAGAHAYVPIIWGLDPTAPHVLYHPNEIIRNAYLTFGLHDSVSLKDRWEKEVSPAERKTVLEAIFARPRPYLERLKEILRRWDLVPSIEPADLERMTPKVQRLLLLMVYAPWLFMDKPEGRENTAMAVAMWNDLLGLGSVYQLNMPGQGMGQWRNRLPPEITVENLERALDVVEARERGEKVEGVQPPQAALDVIRLIKDLQAVRYEFGKRGKEETSAEAVRFLRADPEPGRAVYQLRQSSLENNAMNPFMVDAYFQAKPSDLAAVEAVISGPGLKDPLHLPLTLAAAGSGEEAGVLKYQLSWKPQAAQLAGLKEDGIRSYQVLLQYRTSAGSVHSLAPAHWVLAHDSVETNPLSPAFGLKETAAALAVQSGRTELRVTESDLREAMEPFMERMRTARAARVLEHGIWISGGMVKIDDQTASNIVMAAPRGIYDANLGDRNFTRDFAHVLMEKYGVSADRIRILQMPASSRVLFQRHIRTRTVQEFNRDFVILKVTGILDAEGVAHDYYVAPQPHIQQAFLQGSPVLRKDKAGFPSSMRSRAATLEKPYVDRPHDAHQWISYEAASGKMVLTPEKPSEGEAVQVGLMVPDIAVENVTENIVHNGHVYMLETGVHGSGTNSTSLVAELSRVRWTGAVLHHEGSVRYTLNVPNDRREVASVLEFFRTLKAAGFADALEKRSADHTLPAKVFFLSSSRQAEAELADAELMARAQSVFYQWVISFLKSSMASNPAEIFGLVSEEQEASAGLPPPSASREEPLPETSAVKSETQWTRPRRLVFQTAKPGYGVKLIQFKEPRDTLRQLGIHLEGVPGGAPYQTALTILKANEGTGQTTLWISAPLEQAKSLIEVQVRRNDGSRKLLISEPQRGVTVDLVPGDELTIRDLRFANWVTLRLSGVNRDLSVSFSETSRRPLAVLNAATHAYFLSGHFPGLALQDELDAESPEVDFSEVLRLAARNYEREQDSLTRRHLDEIIRALRFTSFFPDQQVWAHILDLAWKMGDQNLYQAMTRIEDGIRAHHNRLPEKLKELQALTAVPDRDRAGLAALTYFLFRPTPLPWTPAFRRSFGKFLEGGAEAFGKRDELRVQDVFFIDHFEELTHQSARATRRKVNWKLVKNNNFHKDELPAEDGEIRIFENAGERFTFEIGPKHEGVRGRPLLITHYASGKQWFHPNVVVKRFGSFVAKERWVEALTRYGLEGEFADGIPFRVNAFSGDLTYPGRIEKSELRAVAPQTLMTPQAMEDLVRLGFENLALKALAAVDARTAKKEYGPVWEQLKTSGVILAPEEHGARYALALQLIESRQYASAQLLLRQLARMETLYGIFSPGTIAEAKASGRLNQLQRDLDKVKTERGDYVVEGADAAARKKNIAAHLREQWTSDFPDSPEWGTVRQRITTDNAGRFAVKFTRDGVAANAVFELGVREAVEIDFTAEFNNQLFYYTYRLEPVSADKKNLTREFVLERDANLDAKFSKAPFKLFSDSDRILALQESSWNAVTPLIASQIDASDIRTPGLPDFEAVYRTNQTGNLTYKSSLPVLFKLDFPPESLFAVSRTWNEKLKDYVYAFISLDGRGRPVLDASRAPALRLFRLDKRARRITPVAIPVESAVREEAPTLDDKTVRDLIFDHAHSAQPDSPDAVRPFDDYYLKANALGHKNFLKDRPSGDEKDRVILYLGVPAGTFRIRRFFDPEAARWVYQTVQVDERGRVVQGTEKYFSLRRLPDQSVDFDNILAAFEPLISPPVRQLKLPESAVALDRELFLVPSRVYSERLPKLRELKAAYERLDDGQLRSAAAEVPPPVNPGQLWKSFRSEKNKGTAARPASFLIQGPWISSEDQDRHEKAFEETLVSAIRSIQREHPYTQAFWVEIAPSAAAPDKARPVFYVTGIDAARRRVSSVHRFEENTSGGFQETVYSGNVSQDGFEQLLASMIRQGYVLQTPQDGALPVMRLRHQDLEVMLAIDELAWDDLEAVERILAQPLRMQVEEALTGTSAAGALRSRGTDYFRRPSGPSVLEMPFMLRSPERREMFKRARAIATASLAPSREEASRFLNLLTEDLGFYALLGYQRFRLDPISRLSYRMERDETPSAENLERTRKLAAAFTAFYDAYGDGSVVTVIKSKRRPAEQKAASRVRPFSLPVPKLVPSSVPDLADEPAEPETGAVLPVSKEPERVTAPEEIVPEETAAVVQEQVQVPEETLTARFEREVAEALQNPQQGYEFAGWYLDQARELKAVPAPDIAVPEWTAETLLRHALNLLQAAAQSGGYAGLSSKTKAEIMVTRSLIAFEQGDASSAVIHAVEGLLHYAPEPDADREAEIENYVLALDPENAAVLQRQSSRTQAALRELHVRYAAARKRDAPVSELLSLENEILALDAGDHAVKTGRAVRKALQAVEALEARMNDMGEAEYWEAHAAARRGIFNLQEIGADDLSRDRAAVVRLYEHLILKLERDIQRGLVPDQAAFTVRVERRQQAIEKESLFRTDPAVQGRLKVRLMGTVSQFRLKTEEKAAPASAAETTKAPRKQTEAPVKTGRPSAKKETHRPAPVRITSSLAVDLADEQLKAMALAEKWPASIPHQKFAGRLIGIMHALVQELAKEPVDVKRVHGLSRDFFDEWLAISRRNFSPGSVLKPLFEEVSTLSAAAQKKIEAAAKSELRFNAESADLWVRKGPVQIQPDVTLDTILRAQKILRRFWEGLGVAAPGDLQAGRFPAPLVHDRQLDDLMAGLTGTQNQYYLYYLPDFSASAAKAYLAADFLDAYFENPSQLSEVKYLVAGASGNMGRAAAEFAVSLKRHPDYAPYATDLKVVVFAPSHLNPAKREKLLGAGTIVVDHAFSPEELDRYLGADADQRREILALTKAPVFENDQTADAAAVLFAERQGVSARPMRQGSAMGIAAYSVLMFEALDQWYRIQHAEAGHAEVPASAADLAAFAGFVAQDASFQNVRFWIPAGSGTLASGFAQIKQFNEWVEVLVAQSSGADHLLESLKHGSLLPREDFAFDAAAYPMVDSVGSAAEDASFRSLQGMADAVMRVPYEDLGLMTRLVRGLNLTFQNGDHLAAVAADFPAFLPLTNAALARRFGILYPRLLRPGRHVIIPVPGGAPDTQALLENDRIDFAAAFDQLRQAWEGPRAELRSAETLTVEEAQRRLKEALAVEYQAKVDDMDGTMVRHGVAPDEVIQKIQTSLQAGVVRAFASARNETVEEDLRDAGVRDMEEAASRVRQGLNPAEISRLYLFPENASYVTWRVYDAASGQTSRQEVDLAKRYGIVGQDFVFRDEDRRRVLETVHQVLSPDWKDPFRVITPKRYGAEIHLRFDPAMPRSERAKLSNGAAEKVGAFLRASQDSLLKQFEVAASNTTIIVLIKGIDKSLALRFLTDQLGISLDEIAATDDKGGIQGNGWPLTQHRGGFSVNEYNPASEFQVPLKLVWGLEGVDAWLKLESKLRFKTRAELRIGQPLIEIRSRREYLDRFREGIVTVASEVTADIFEVDYASELFRGILAERAALDQTPFEMKDSELESLAADYALLTQRGAHVVLPAAAFASLSDKALQGFFEAILRGAQKAPAASLPRLYFAGAGASELKAKFFTYEVLHQARASRIFQVQLQEESVIANRLRSRPSSVSVVKVPAEDSPLALEIPAFFIQADEIRRLGETDKVRYLTRLSQLQLLAAEELKDQLRDPRPEQVRRVLGEFLAKVGIDYTQGPGGFLSPSQASLLSHALSQYLAANRATAKAA